MKKLENILKQKEDYVTKLMDIIENSPDDKMRHDALFFLVENF